MLCCFTTRNCRVRLIFFEHLDLSKLICYHASLPCVDGWNLGTWNLWRNCHPQLGGVALTEARSFEACSGFGVLSGLGGPSLLVLSTGFRRKPTIFSQFEAIHTNPVSRILGKNSLRMLCFMLEQTVEVLNSGCMASFLGWSLSKFPRKFATYLSPVAKNCLVSAKIVVLKHCFSVFFWTGAQNVNKHVDFCSVLWCAWSSWRIFLWKERSPSPFYCECTSDRQTYA